MNNLLGGPSIKLGGLLPKRVFICLQSRRLCLVLSCAETRVRYGVDGTDPVGLGQTEPLRCECVAARGALGRADDAVREEVHVVDLVDRHVLSAVVLRRRGHLFVPLMRGAQCPIALLVEGAGLVGGGDVAPGVE